MIIVPRERNDVDMRVPRGSSLSFVSQAVICADPFLSIRFWFIYGAKYRNLRTQNEYDSHWYAAANGLQPERA